MFTEIFTLTEEQLEAAKIIIDTMITNNADVAEFKNSPFNLYIVKDGTQEAEDRKKLPDAILGPIEYKNQQYLLAAK
jgi:hypothetical protein